MKPNLSSPFCNKNQLGRFVVFDVVELATTKPLLLLLPSSSVDRPSRSDWAGGSIRGRVLTCQNSQDFPVQQRERGEERTAS